jgi:mRNA-degrading endonuclease RelE of RelBE toxin-antitoxin system
MRFRLTTDAKKYINRQNKETKNRIYKSLRDASKEPPEGDMIIMSDGSGRWRLRTGDFRAIIKIEGNILT